MNLRVIVNGALVSVPRADRDPALTDLVAEGSSLFELKRAGSGLHLALQRLDLRRRWRW